MEEFKIIKFEPNYEVSNLGNVRNKYTKKCKSLRLDKNGYMRVTLYPSGRTYSVHRLVALSWLEDSYQEGLQVDHLNHNKTDNSVTNLEWVTPKINMNRRKTIPRPTGETNPMCTITESIAFNIKYDFERTINEKIKYYNVSRNLIEHIHRRETWIHLTDDTLEELFLKGELSYKRDKNSNIPHNIKESIKEDIIEGKLLVKDIAVKYNISRNSVSNIKKNIGS